MTIAQESETILCPHCGARLDIDEELCRTCGKLMVAYSAPKASYMAGFLGAIGSWIREGLRNPDAKRTVAGPRVNPSTGLPAEGGVDIAGNVIGRGSLWNDD
jgi:predicted RNA-binding Zn-ribbon protein involved in translation (DUF1610 family)